MKYNYEKLSDEELFTLLSESKEVSNNAFSEIYKRYSEKIYSYLSKLLGNKFFIKDIFQEIFSRIYFAGLNQKNKNIYNLSNYIYQTARNVCINHYRNENKMPEIHKEFATYYSEEKVDYSDKLDLIKVAISKLPENIRELLVMYEYEGLSYRAISEITGDSEGNVRVKVHRARKLLREKVISMQRLMKNMVYDE